MPGTRVTPSRAAAPPGGARLRLIGLDSSPLHGELLGVERLEERARAAGGGIHPRTQPAAWPPAAAAPRARRRTRAPPRLSPPRRRRAARRADRARGRVAARQLPPGGRRDPRDPPSPSDSLLPRASEAATRELAGTARVYAMAVELLRYSDARLDAHRLRRFICAYQTVAPHTIGELWAWPSMLKLALIEHLRRLSEELSPILQSDPARERQVPVPVSAAAGAARARALLARRERARPADPGHRDDGAAREGAPSGDLGAAHRRGWRRRARGLPGLQGCAAAPRSRLRRRIRGEFALVRGVRTA